MQRILKQNELAKIVKEAKSEGKTVVSTNGVFDFIHTGHLAYLEKSRELGDMLVIALNSDASVQRIKGPTRPINKEEDRAKILAGLRCVDYVTIFNEDTSVPILDKIKPSIHTKAGDYTPDVMPETSTIEKNDGKVVIIPLAEGYSNSGQYERIIEAAKADAEKEFKRPEFLAGK